MPQPLNKSLLFALVLVSTNAFAQENETETVEESTVVDHRLSSGTGFALAAGPFATFRRMTLEGSLRDIEHVPGFYIGGFLELQVALAKIASYGTLSLKLDGGFSSAKSADVDASIGRQLVTEHTFIDVALQLNRPLTERFDMIFVVGGGATSFTVEPNARYTGHRYITVNFGVLTQYWFNPRGYFGGGIIARPSLFTDQSSGADGPGRGFGMNPTAMFGYRILQPVTNDINNAVELILSYDLNYFSASFPLSGRVGADPISTDLSHTATLSLQYNL